MAEGICVKVVAYPDRKFLVLRFADPLTGRLKTKSAKTTNHKEAVKAAGKWEAELREGRYAPLSKLTWADFRKRYEDEVLAAAAIATDKKVSGVFNAVERILSPAKLRDLTAQRLSYFQSKLREAGRAEDTIKGSMAHLAATLSWAVKMGMLSKVPEIELPKRAKGSKLMKGRPITGEVFERMLVKVPAVVGEEAAPSWIHYLEGLWLSGLRLAESLELYWDRDDRLCVDLGGTRPMLRIPAALEKGNKDRLLPMAPEFAEFLLKTPNAQRTGRVFNPRANRVHGERLGTHRVGEILSVIGELAGVKVNTTTADGREIVKYASAHDLRRSFGERWAGRIMPTDLMVLMRHESINTTLRYYVGANAQKTAETLWAAHRQATGNISGNTPQKRPKPRKDRS
jgi:integrase